MEKWGPAKTEGKAENTSVSLEIHMDRGDVKMRRMDFNFANFTNIQSAGKPEIKGSKKSNLSVEWEVLTQSNSALPWDMTRSVTIDWENNVWITTDDGLCKITANRIEVFNAKNSPIEDKFGKSFTSNISLDSNGNIWFANSYQIIKYDHKQWSVFDTLNSPMEFLSRGTISDRTGSVFFKTHKGLRMYDGENWHTFQEYGSDLLSKRISGVFRDSQNHLWVGTYEGNLRIESDTITYFHEDKGPLSHAFMKKMVEDATGNLWFSVYSEKEEECGMWKLDQAGNYTLIHPNDKDVYPSNSINDFFLDEENEDLWIAVHKVGLVKHELDTGKWEVYTTQNSNIPSTIVSGIAK
ncbi:MAG: two-component regulator propeller domain-containing protein, partial [Bacteroidota bacterium]